MARKVYFFIISQGYSYCVPSRDVMSADVGSVQVGQEIKFKYSNLTFTGVVQFISKDEKEVLSEIKKEKKAKKPKQEPSFHEEMPRKSALQQRALMSGLKSATSAKVKIKQEEEEEETLCKPILSVKAKKVKEKQERDIKVAKAASLTENNMISSHALKREANKSTSDGDSDEKANDDGCSSTSSIDENCRGKSQAEDIAKLKALESDSSDNPTCNEQGELAFNGKNSDSMDVDEDSSVPVTGDAKQDKESEPVDKAQPFTGAASAQAVCEAGPSGFHLKSENGDLPLDRDSSANDSSPSDEGHRARKKAKKVKRSGKRSESSSSSSSTSSSSSSSSCSSSTSSSSSEEKKRKKRKHRKSRKSKSKKSRRGRKNKKSKKSRRIDTSDESDVEEKPRKNRKSKRSVAVKRNMEIYPGQNYNYHENDPDVVRISAQHAVYLPSKLLDDTLKDAKSVPLFIKAMVSHVYTKEAIRGSTAQGYPNRNRGSSKMKQANVLPRLDPEGRAAILACAVQLENDRKAWRPRIGKQTMCQSFTQAVGKLSD